MSSSGYFPFEATGEVACFIAEKSARILLTTMQDENSSQEETNARLTHLFLASAFAATLTSDSETYDQDKHEEIFKACLVVAGCSEDKADLIRRVNCSDRFKRRMHASLSYVPDNAEGFGIEKTRTGRSVDMAKFLIENFSEV